MQDTSLTFHISLNALRKTAGTWGDMHYATALAHALEAQGAQARLFFRGEDPDLTGQGDIVLRILGPTLDEPVAGLPNMVWIISPPNLVVAPVVTRYQKVFVASERYAAQLADMGASTEYVPQATDTSLFHPSKRPSGAEVFPIVFVGAHAPRARRPAVTDAVAAGLDVHVWGPGWDGVIPAKNWRGERLDQNELAQVYARARIILNAHMPQMAFHGMMSNRTFDALAAGAAVVSDRVQGFHAPDLPELYQMSPGPDLIALLRDLLDGPEPDEKIRMARHDSIVERYSFAAVAARFISTARALIASGKVTPSAFVPRPSGSAPPIVLHPPNASAVDQYDGLEAAAQSIQEIFARLEYPKRAPTAPPQTIGTESEGVLHPLMYDLRRAQRLLLDDVPPEKVIAQGHIDILHRARRITEAGRKIAPRRSPRREVSVTRLMRGEPIWDHTPENYDRDALKRHVALWPRKDPARLKTPIGVFLHLYYHDLAPIFAKHLAKIDAPFAVYISTDTSEKADAIKSVFPQAEIRILPNVGRDIYPKFYGFSDVYDRHDVVLHLHGKKSTHSNKLEQWLAHNLECLLPDRSQINRILSFFQSVPKLGLISPAVFQPVISAAHWGANFEIGQELAWRMGLDAENLPGNDSLRFPVGSMFWGRRAALQPLLDLGLRPGHFPPEAGQTDGTTAHAIERMLGVCCGATGHHMIAVTPAGSSLYTRYKTEFDSNKALRESLEG